MKITERNNTLVNISNSILKFYDIPTFHNSYDELDKILEKNKNKKLCLILLDGFGKIILEKYKKYCPFLYSHINLDCYSVYPPTTVAATTSLMSGKYPCETGFLGWNQNFKSLNAYINVFINNNKVTKERLETINVQKDILKPTYIVDLINSKYGNDSAKWVSSFDFKKDGKDNFDLFFKEGNKEIKNHKFTYLYSTQPDHNMHTYGTDSIYVKQIIRKLDKKVKKLVHQNKDTLFLIIADHGFIDFENIYLNHDNELLETLKDKDAIFSIEGRFASFEVKEDKLNDFISIYNKKYKDKFILKSKKEIIEEEYFGKGNNHELFDSFLGDYFFLATSTYSLADNDDFSLKAGHAGITDQELELELMIFND